MLVRTVEGLYHLEVQSVNLKLFSRSACLIQDVIVLTISMDLSFAQERLCGNAKADNIVVL
jgi:peroxiredoxin